MPDPILIPHLAMQTITLVNPDGKPVGEIAGDKHGGIVTLCDANGAVRVTAVAAADQSGVTLHANGETALVAYVDAAGALMTQRIQDRERQQAAAEKARAAGDKRIDAIRRKFDDEQFAAGNKPRDTA